MSAAERIEALGARNAAAVELALAVSLAVRVDPDLLRHARLMVGADASAEADLWWSDLVAAQNPDGFMLAPDVAEELRARLAQPQRRELRDAAWALVSSQHATAHLATRLEELVNWLSIAASAEAEDRIEELLVAGVDEWMASATEPSGGVRWILSALQRLPRAAAGSPAATVIGAAAATHAGGEVPKLPADAELPSDALDNWYPWLLARLPTTSIAVTLVDGGIEFEGSGEQVHALTVPRTDPVQLELTWHDGGPRRQQVRVTRGERTTVALRADEVELTTLAGQRSTIRRVGRPAATAGLDFAAVRAAHRPAGGLEDLVERVVARVGERNGWLAIGGEDGTGKTTALCAALDALEAEGYVVLQHFYGRGPSWWDDHETVMRSLVAQLRVAVPALPSLPDAAVRGAPRSNVDEPRTTLDEVISTAYAERDGPGVVVALDDPPAHGFDDVRSWVSRSGFPSLVRSRSSFIVAGRYAGGVRDWLEDGDPYWSVDVKMEVRDRVCQAYIRSLWAPLIAALGLPSAPLVAFSGTAPEGLTSRLRSAGFESMLAATPLEDAVERCDAGVIVLGDEPRPEQLAFGRLCRDRGRPLVVVVVGDANWEGMQAVAGGDLEVADRISAAYLRGSMARGDDEPPTDEDDAALQLVAGELEQRLRERVWPFVAELIDLGGGTIERVRPLVDWIASQPPGQASLETIPPSLTGRLPWGELEGPGRHLIAVVAVAQPGFTLADALWATPPDDWPGLVAAVARLYDLHLLRDPSGLLAALPASEDLAPDALVEAFGPALLQSTDPGLAESIRPAVGDGGLLNAHRWLAQAGDGRVGSAPGYLARHAMAHAVAWGYVEVVRGLCDESALTRQARRLGLQAVAADLTLARTLVDDRFLAAVHDAVIAVANRGGGEADFPRLLYHELAFRLGGHEASYHLHPNETMQPYLQAWTSPFGDPERETGHVDVAALIELDRGLAAVSHSGEVFAVGATASWRLPSNFGPGVAVTGLPGQRIAVVAGRSVTIGSPDDEVMLPVPPGDLELVWAGSAAGGLLAATADGALVYWPRAEAEPRVLLAHSGALTCMTTGPAATWEVIARDAVVRIVVDGTFAGYGLFVADGVVIADGAAAAAIESGRELAVQINDSVHVAGVEHRAAPGTLTLLRAEVAGHAIVPLAAPAAPDQTELRLDRHDVVGPSLIGGRTVLMLRRRATGAVLGDVSARQAFEQSGLGGFVFDRGCLYGVILTRDDDSMVAAEPVAPLEPLLAGDRAALRQLVRADTWFATGSEDGTVAVWSANAGAPIAVYRGHGAAVRTVAVVGRHLVSGGDDGTLRLWTPADGHDVAVLGVSRVAITASAATSSGCVWGAADGALGIWRPEAGPVSERLSPHAGSVIGLHVEEDTVLSWAADGSVAIRPLDGSEPESALHGPAPVRHVARSGPGEIAVLWSDDSVTVERVPPGDRAAGAACLAVAPDGEAIAIGSGDRHGTVGREGGWEWHPHAAMPVHCAFGRTGPSEIRLFVLTSADAAKGWGRGGRPTSIALAGGFVLVGRSDGSIASSRPAEFARVGSTIAARSGSAPVASLAGADGSSLLLAGHEDGSVRLWDVDAAGSRLVNAFKQGHPATAVALAGSLAAAADGTSIRLWDVEAGVEAGVLTGPGARVTGLAAAGPSAAGHSSALVSCDEEGWLRLWDTGSGRCLESLRAPRPLVAVAAGAATVAARDAGGATYAWSIRWLAHAAADVAMAGALRIDVDPHGQRIEGRGTLSFAFDVELRSIRWDAPVPAPGGRSTTRVAIDQPEGFWEELDEHGAFVAPPLVAAGREIHVRIQSSELPGELDEAGALHALVELSSPRLLAPVTVAWQPEGFLEGGAG